MNFKKGAKSIQTAAYHGASTVYEKANLRSDFWQSKYILQKYYFDGGQKFIHVSYNEWSLQHISIL